MRLFLKKTSKRVSPRRTLEAAVARRAARAPSIEEEDEPTTSFKTALVVVLLLHVVAGGGILMFDRIKTRRPNAFETPAAAQSAVVSKTAATLPKVSPQPLAATPAAAHPKAPVAVEPVKKAASPAAELKDSGTMYTVAKGETPVSIARKLKVGYDDLLKLNKIDDPKKIRIGQKLHVPVKPRASNN